MKFMMVFFGFMFFRVPAGLCLYFITSSAWGLAERMLLPKSKGEGKGAARRVKSSTSAGDGAARVAERKRLKQKRAVNGEDGRHDRRHSFRCRWRRPRHPAAQRTTRR